MTALDKLATALNRRDEVLNLELAEQIVLHNDNAAVKELVDGLGHRDARIRSDCIKALYEIGARDPSLIAGYLGIFADLLDSRNNRMVWGAMTALDHIAVADPEGVYALLDKICATADNGSVITRDHAVGILTKLASLSRFSDACTLLLIEQLSACPNNQLPMYAEMSLVVTSSHSRLSLYKVLLDRLAGIEKESQKRRVQRVLNRINREFK